MSHLGIISAVGLATKDIEVLCLDKNEELIKQLENGQFPVVEESLELHFKNNRKNLNFSNDFSAIQYCDLVYISLDVPTDELGTSDTTTLNQYIEAVVPFLKEKSGIVILSQIMPGFCRQLNKKFTNYLAYQVETLVFGNAIERVLFPERFIIGLLDSDSKLLPVHERVLKLFECPILVMSYESAELAKISINVFLASSLLAANSLSQVAESIGGFWPDIESALKLDKRIGVYAYTRAGLGISGGNIERDIESARNLALLHNCDTGLFQAINYNSKFRKQWPAQILLSIIPHITEMPTVAVWGITYKSNTHSLKNSPALKNIEILLSVCNLQVSDPLVSLPENLKNKVIFNSSASKVLEGADVLIIFNDSREFRDITIHEIKMKMRNRIIIDPYRVLHDKVDDDFDYFTLGSKPKMRKRGV